MTCLFFFRPGHASSSSTHEPSCYAASCFFFCESLLLCHELLLLLPRTFLLCRKPPCFIREVAILLLRGASLSLLRVCLLLPFFHEISFFIEVFQLRIKLILNSIDDLQMSRSHVSSSRWTSVNEELEHLVANMPKLTIEEHGEWKELANMMQHVVAPPEALFQTISARDQIFGEVGKVYAFKWKYVLNIV
ncbi:hypothetical protein HKD37_16G045651 [Glycine soja]